MSYDDVSRIRAREAIASKRRHGSLATRLRAAIWSRCRSRESSSSRSCRPELGPTRMGGDHPGGRGPVRRRLRDHQWIHADPERAAKESPYGTTVAHGNLTLSLLDYFRPQLIQNRGVKMGINYGFNKVRFPAAVPAGTRVRARAELLSVEELGDGWWHVVTKFTVEGEGQEKPVCVAESVGRALDRLERPPMAAATRRSASPPSRRPVAVDAAVEGVGARLQVHGERGLALLVTSLQPTSLPLESLTQTSCPVGAGCRSRSCRSPPGRERRLLVGELRWGRPRG